MPVLEIATAIAAALAACGIAYYGLCLWSALGFARHGRRVRPVVPEMTPPVSLLKPLRGTDPGMYEAFRSHCRQDYPDYELIFGVAEADDPAAALVRRLQREFPERRIELVVCPLALGTNSKVSNLVQMLPHARHEYLLLNDGDIRVPPDYLRRVLQPFADPQVGMVTSLYRGAASRTVASKLEALGIGTDFFCGVLVARELEGVHFGLGATLAFPRRSLTAIGGFEPLLDYLADDYELGARISAAGYEVVISDVVVDTHLPDYTFAGYWNHQMRWARGVRDVRKGGYLGLVVSFGLPWALLALVLARRADWAWSLLGVTLLVRLALVWVMSRRVLQDGGILKDLWLLPLRDVLALIVWMASYGGHVVVWRDRRFLLENGKLKPVGDRQEQTRPV